MIRRAFIENRIKLVGLFILNLTLTLFAIVQTFIFGRYVNLLISKASFNTLLYNTLLLVAISVVSVVFKYINNILNGKAQADIVYKINYYQLKHLKKVSLSYFSKIDTVYLTQRINSDSYIVTNFYLTMISGGIAQFLALLIILGVLFVLNKIIFLVVSVGLSIFVIIYLFYKKRLFEVNKNFTEQQNILFSKLYKQIQYPKYNKIKVIFRELDNELKCEREPFFRHLDKFLKVTFRFNSLNDAFNNIFNIFLYLYCGYSIFQGEMTIGVFLILRNYLSYLITILSQILELIKTIPNKNVSKQRLEETEYQNEEQNGKTILSDITSIRAINLSYGYDDLLAKNINLSFNKGKVYLVKGANGCGKTTLVNLLIGIQSATSKGTILINNEDISNIDLYDFRKKLVGISEQEPISLDLDSKNVDSDVLQSNLAFLNFISFEKNGVSEMSGGEKQKVSIALALAKDPKLLILDEPNSALDKQSKSNLLNLVENNKDERITIIIAHDNLFDAIVDSIVNL